MASFSTITSIRRDLSTLGMTKGDAVFVHASMRAIGTTVGGPRVIIEALIEAVGPTGLIAMPGFSGDALFTEDINVDDLTDEERREIEAAVPGFDAANSPTFEMGAIAEMFRTWPGTLRSDHPSMSVCLNGFEAEDYLTPHSVAWATGEETPFGKLYHRPSTKILMIGVGWNRCTALHMAETFAENRRTKMLRYKEAVYDGVWKEAIDVADDVSRLFPSVGSAFENAGSVVTGSIGQAECRVVDFKACVDFASDWINRANLASGEKH